MKPRKPLIELSPSEQEELRHQVRSGNRPAREVVRGLCLLALADGQSEAQVARSLGIGGRTVRWRRQRYQQGGLEAALHDRARPGAPARIRPAEKQRIVAMVCGPLPEGQARWSVRLTAREAVRRGLVSAIGRESIRGLLQQHELKPWREKNLVHGHPGRGVPAPDGRHSRVVRAPAQPRRTRTLSGRKAGAAA